MIVMNLLNLLINLYIISLIGVAVYAFNALVLSAFFLKYRHQRLETPPIEALGAWPPVTVQLPIFNERFVVERQTDAMAALD